MSEVLTKPQTIKTPQLQLTQLYPQSQQLTIQQFNRISSFMEKTTGIKLPESKRSMIQARLANRLKVLNFENYSQYIDFVFSSQEHATEEITMMIDLLTTNLTRFFREQTHFGFMEQSVLPTLVKDGITKPEIWSAGCSSGEEPYTLSIVMKEFMKNNPGKIFHTV